MLFFVNIVSLRFTMAMIRFYPRQRSEAGAVMAAGLVYWAAVSAITGLVLALASDHLAQSVFAHAEQKRLLVLAVVAGLLATLYEFVSVTLRAENRFGLVSVVDVAERVLFLIACVLAFAAGYTTVEAVMYLLVGTTALKIIVVAAPSLAHVRFCWPSSPQLREMFAFCLPFIPHLAGIWLIERGSFFIVALEMGSEPTGIYTLAFTLAALLSAVIFPLQATLYPMLSRAYDEGRVQDLQELTQLALRLTLSFTVFATISLTIGARPVLWLLDIGEATPAPLLLLLMCLAFIATAVRQIVMNVLHVEKRTYVLLWTAPLGALAAALCFLLLVTPMGLVGAAAGVLVGTTVQIAAMLLLVPKHLLAAPSRRYVTALAGSAFGALVVQLVAARFGEVPYLFGVALSAFLYGATHYYWGALTQDEKLAVRAKLKGVFRFSGNVGVAD
jgi:O-antigen/teichoic acid export membrane protein